MQLGLNGLMVTMNEVSSQVLKVLMQDMQEFKKYQWRLGVLGYFGGGKASVQD